ncbi:UNVERIFIED_CONTAM: protein NRT1/ PTR FAMILY 5.4 [Sesamum latifolium]|uniref:Protein NRT1/ PTR FAMILY 5.4 n=1 Tax=Sesamum latifolium TaxID=2727402 RepID=A0AAW2XP98_9LAMI
MAVAASVEAKRVNAARNNGLVDKPKSVVPMAIWWLVPQYVMCGLSDMFTVVGLQELFYDQMPVEMRSVGAAAYISVIGIGSFLSSGLICIVQGVSSRAGVSGLGTTLTGLILSIFTGFWLL